MIKIKIKNQRNNFEFINLGIGQEKPTLWFSFYVNAQVYNKQNYFLFLVK